MWISFKLSNRMKALGLVYIIDNKLILVFVLNHRAWLLETYYIFS